MRAKKVADITEEIIVEMESLKESILEETCRACEGSGLVKRGTSDVDMVCEVCEGTGK